MSENHLYFHGGIAIQAEKLLHVPRAGLLAHGRLLCPLTHPEGQGERSTVNVQGERYGYQGRKTSFSDG